MNNTSDLRGEELRLRILEVIPKNRHGIVTIGVARKFPDIPRTRIYSALQSLKNSGRLINKTAKEDHPAKSAVWVLPEEYIPNER